MKFSIGLIVFGILDFIVTALLLIFTFFIFPEFPFDLNYKELYNTEEVFVNVDAEKKYIIAVLYKENISPDFDKSSLKIKLSINNNKGSDYFTRVDPDGGKSRFKIDNDWIISDEIYKLIINKSGKLGIESNINEIEGYYISIQEDKSMVAILSLMFVFVLGTVIALIITIFVHKKYLKGRKA